MSRRIAALMLVAFVLGAGIGGIAGVFIFIRTVGGSGEPSVTISAPTLSLAMLTTTPAAAQPDMVAMGTQVAIMAAQVNQLVQATPDDHTLNQLGTDVAEIGTQIAEGAVQKPDPSTPVAIAATPSRTPSLT